MSGPTAFDAAAIISGVLNPARLGTGSADSTTYLRGDGTWQAIDLSAYLAKADNLSGLASVSTARTNLGLGTGDSPTFTGLTTTGSVHTPYTGASNTTKITYEASAMTHYIGDATNASALLNTGGFRIRSVGAYSFSANNAPQSTAADLYLYRDAAGILAQRNSTNGQKSRIYKTYTSSTSGEWLEFDAADNASNFDIAACVGSLGGTARGLRFGSKNAAGTFTSWLAFAAAGAATFSGAVTVNGKLVTGGSAFAVDQSTGHTKVYNNGCFGFTASGTADTIVEMRMVRDSTNVFGFVTGASGSTKAGITAGNITSDGAIQLGNAAVAATPTATHTLTIKDSTGTTYRILAVV